MEIQKQKAQNVDLFILIFFMASASISLAQNKLEGTYCVDYSMNDIYKCIEFQENRTFEYHTGGDLGDENYGMGQFSFDNGFLILDYNNTPPKEAGYFKYSYWENKGDSMGIVLKAMNKNDMKNVNVLVLPENVILKTNEDGRVEFKIKKSNQTNRLIVSALGYQKLEIVLSNPYNYNIQAHLEKAYTGNPIKDQIDTLKILELNKSFFKTKNQNGKIINWVRQE